MALIEIKFPGNKRVDAHIKGHVVKSDQPEYAGGDNTAPAPFQIFLTSIASCAGIYALSFCQNKNIDTEGLALEMDIVQNPETKMVEDVILNLTLPKDFPEKYKGAIVRSIDLCTVKKHMLNPPSFAINTTLAE